MPSNRQLGMRMIGAGRMDDLCINCITLSSQRALEKAMLTWRGVNAVSMIAFGEYQLGRIAARLGHSGEAMQRFDASRRHFSELGELTEVVVVDALRAEALTLADDHEAALALADATLARAQTLGGVSAMTPLLHRVRGASLRELGRPAEAERAVRDASTLRAAASRATRSLVRARGTD